MHFSLYRHAYLILFFFFFQYSKVCTHSPLHSTYSQVFLILLIVVVQLSFICHSVVIQLWCSHRSVVVQSSFSYFSVVAQLSFSYRLVVVHYRSVVVSYRSVVVQLFSSLSFSKVRGSRNLLFRLDTDRSLFHSLHHLSVEK